MKEILLIILFLSVSHLCHAQPEIKWKFDTKDIAFGQSASADIDGDGKLEIVFGCYRNDSMIYAVNAEDGSLLWKYNAASTFFEGCNDVAPLIYDIDGDGNPEVIVPASCNPRTFCLDGATGAVKWVCNTRGSDSPPTIADIDGDGTLEILHGEFGGYVICINAEDGTVAWEIAVDTDSWIQTAPTILDVDGDGQLDFVVATWNAVDRAKNKIYAYRANDQRILWTYSVSDVIYHGTAVGDLDGDGKPELVIGSYNDTLYCLNAEDGSLNWSYSVGEYYSVSSPAVIADINDDGQCEIIFNAWYKVIALEADGSLLWDYDINRYQSAFRGVAVSDVNNDRYRDVLFGTTGGEVVGLNGNDGSVIFNKNLRSQYGDSLFSILHAPLVADFDQDGTMDVFIQGGHGQSPDFSNDFGRAYLLSIGKGNGPDWLMFQHDILRQSNACIGTSDVSSHPQSSDNDVNIYPLPSKHHTNIDITLTHATDINIIIYNLSGLPVDNLYNGPISGGKHTLAWKIPNGTSAGVYFCRILVDNNIIVKRILVL